MRAKILHSVVYGKGMIVFFKQIQCKELKIWKKDLKGFG
jgi:hypothetical protein